MINDTIITVKNLGKKYHIRHQHAERYTALRNVIITRAAALLRPLLTMLVFVFIFGRIARLPAEGLPYTLMFFTAMLPAGFCDASLSQGRNSLIINSTLMSKICFPCLGSSITLPI
jgi:hypothetical protein